MRRNLRKCASMVRKSTTRPATTLAWDDLRFALSLARGGAVRSAARALGVSHSTVLRRLAALERSVGARLFERRPDGWALTAAGQDVCETAEALEDVVAGLERRVEGRDLRPAGPVRVTLPDPLLPPLLPIFRELRAACPDIEVTLDGGAVYRDLAQREADLALRIAASPPPELVGRRLGWVETGVYASRAYLAALPAKRRTDLAALDWIGFEQGSSMLFEAWRAANVPGARIALRATTPWAQRDAVSAGLGAAIVPCMAGDAEPEWQLVRALPREVGAPLWILSHADLRTTARVRLVRDHLADAIVQRKLLRDVSARTRRRSS